MRRSSIHGCIVSPTASNPVPDLLPNVFRPLVFPDLLQDINLSLFCEDIALISEQPSSAPNDLPANEQYHMDGNPNIGRDEVVHIPIPRKKDSKPIENGDN